MRTASSRLSAIVVSCGHERIGRHPSRPREPRRCDMVRHRPARPRGRRVLGAPPASPRYRVFLVITGAANAANIRSTSPALRAGSIPACAGEPPTRRPALRSEWVYPRVCGGTGLVVSSPTVSAGLSPRVRGNLTLAGNRPDMKGSIPACAGEPCSGRRKSGRTRVYPRVCGGTTRNWMSGSPFQGLSPRVRGNPAGAGARGHLLGSIPACAGEPHVSPGSRGALKVYPRVCGGTAAAMPVRELLLGLSPRVRGNHGPVDPSCSGGGSIPACAGEPREAAESRRSRRVYPRVCGGTHGGGIASLRFPGLSPRVRGNPELRAPRREGAGSIPACAGEPEGLELAGLPLEVYPRVCGGTTPDTLKRYPPLGLSPRVRGNPALNHRRRGGLGSIPACAGEPCSIR